jgi:acyl carrier protein
MEVEDEFGISIPDSAASEISTVSDLVDLCFSRVEAIGSSPCVTLTSFLALRTLVREVAGSPELIVRPRYGINETIGRAERQKLWLRLPELMETVPQALRRPIWLRRALVSSVIGFFILTFFALPPLPEIFVLNFLATSAYAIAVFLATLRFRTDAPKKLETFEDIARKIAGLTIAVNTSAETTYSQVFETAKRIIVETLGVDETEVVPTARFVEDLGAG